MNIHKYIKTHTYWFVHKILTLLITNFYTMKLHDMNRNKGNCMRTYTPKGLRRNQQIRSFKNFALVPRILR
jgi:hypothetical protein